MFLRSLLVHKVVPFSFIVLFRVSLFISLNAFVCQRSLRELFALLISFRINLFLIDFSLLALPQNLFAIS